MRIVLAIFCAAGLALACCQSIEARGGAHAPSSRAVPREMPGLHNVLAFADAVLSGSMPHGDAGFQSLADLGVRTIVSVDAAPPDLNRAHAQDMRYVHIPIQYSGIDPNERLAFARALREMPRPIYFHCHHGKHRGPAAGAYALVACGEVTSEDGVALMREAGTSDKYPGLYATVLTASPVSDAQVAAAVRAGLAKLPQEAKVDGFAGAMAMLDRAWDHMLLVRDAGWQAPPDHPDLAPAAEAALIANTLGNLQSDPSPDPEHVSPDFLARLTEAHRHAKNLEDALIAGDHAAAAGAMQRLGASCNACHATYRNE